MNECPTCGSTSKHVRLVTAYLDAPSPFKGKVSQRIKSPDYTVVEHGEWIGGVCPDTWHDYERRAGTIGEKHDPN